MPFFTLGCPKWHLPLSTVTTVIVLLAIIEIIEVIVSITKIDLMLVVHIVSRRTLETCIPTLLKGRQRNTSLYGVTQFFAQFLDHLRMREPWDWLLGGPSLPLVLFLLLFLLATRISNSRRVGFLSLEVRG